MPMTERIARLAKIWNLTAQDPAKLDVVKHRGSWWLVGADGGDHPLPCTDGLHRLPDVLDAVEAWLAPEIDREDAP